jgi:hypothetical protein
VVQLQVYELHQMCTSLKRPVLYHHVHLVPSSRLGRTIAWVAMFSTSAQMEINVQCSAAGARRERIVEKGPRLSLLYMQLLTTTRARLSAMAKLI